MLQNISFGDREGVTNDSIVASSATVGNQIALLTHHLDRHHRKELFEKRGLNSEWIEVNCRSVSSLDASELLGYKAQSDGIWLEGTNFQGQFKPDKAWKSKDEKGHAPKYRSALGEYDAMLPIHPTISNYWDDLEALHRLCYIINGIACILLTEGFFKAIAGCSNGLPTIALQGVEMGLTPSIDDPQGKRYLVPILERFARAGFGFIICFDADAATNENVLMAQLKLAHQLQKFKVPVYSVTGLWEKDQSYKNENKGMDDYIQNHGADKFRSEVLARAQAIEQWEKQFKKDEEETKKPPTPKEIADKLAEKYQPTWKYHNEQKTWREHRDGIWNGIEKTAFEARIATLLDADGVPWSLPAFIKNTEQCLEYKLMVEEWQIADRTKFVAFNNGVVDLTTNKLLPHSSGYGFLSKLSLDYKQLPNSDNDVIELLKQHAPATFRFMYDAMEGDQKRILKLLAIVNGVVKFRYHDLQMFVHLVGKPGTGKSTFAELLSACVGTANTASARLQALDEAYTLAEIIDKQLVICPDEDKKVGGFGGLKALTGGSAISYRAPYKEVGSSKFYGALVVISNSPIFAGDTTGLDRRVCLVSFNKPVPAHLRTKAVEDAVCAEAASVISVALTMTDEEVTQVLKGIGDALIPEFRRQQWLLKVQTNSVVAHLNEWLIYDPEAEIKPQELFDHYKNYCQNAGLMPVSLTKYPESLLDVCDSLEWNVTRHRSNGKRFIKGIRLRSEALDVDIPWVEDFFIPPSADPSAEESADPSAGLKGLPNKESDDSDGLKGKKLLEDSQSNENKNHTIEEKNIGTKPVTEPKVSTDKGLNPSLGSALNPSLGSKEGNNCSLAQKMIEAWDNRTLLGEIVLSADAGKLAKEVECYTEEQIAHVKNAANEVWQPGLNRDGDYNGERVEIWQVGQSREITIRTSSGTTQRIKRGNLKPWLGI